MDQWSLEPKPPLVPKSTMKKGGFSGDFDQISRDLVKIPYFSGAPAAHSEGILHLETVQNPIFFRAPAARRILCACGTKYIYGHRPGLCVCGG